MFWAFRPIRPAFQAYLLLHRALPGASPAGYRPSGLSGLAVERSGRARLCRRPALRDGISQDSRDGVPRHGWRARAGFGLRDRVPRYCRDGIPTYATRADQNWAQKNPGGVRRGFRGRGTFLSPV